MDSCNLWETNYFWLLFDAHIPTYEDNIIEERHAKVVPTSIQNNSSIVVVFLLEPTFYSCMEDIFSMEGPIYLDPNDHGDTFEHHTQSFMCIKLGVNVITGTWDLGLWKGFLDY